MNGDKEFYTQMGYRLQNAGGLTDTMEDYLEMIARCAQETGYVRMNQLAERLHVRPSSASKMVGKLKELGLLDFEKYGLIGMTEEGRTVGQALLRRHDHSAPLFLSAQSLRQRAGAGGAGGAFYPPRHAGAPGSPHAAAGSGGQGIKSAGKAAWLSRRRYNDCQTAAMSSTSTSTFLGSCLAATQERAGLLTK